MTDYGRDISCTDSLKTGRFSSGVRAVAEACYRRLTTPRGMLRGGEAEANYGLDLAGKIGSASTKNEAAALPGLISSELLKDERIETIAVTVVDTTSGPGKSFEVTVIATTADGPFTLQLAVKDVTTALLGITA